MGEAQEAILKTLLWLAAAIFALALIVGLGIGYGLPKSKTDCPYEFKCLGCGSEFTSSNQLKKDVSSCPNCPLSWEEFEELRKQALEKEFDPDSRAFRHQLKPAKKVVPSGLENQDSRYDNDIGPG